MNSDEVINENTVETKHEDGVKEAETQTTIKNNNQDHKPKRRRRGKKRKHRKESTNACQNEAESPVWDSDENLSNCGMSSFNNVVIRPINVPKAPENSTQFIMDDHDECRLYMSFENPKPYFMDWLNQENEQYDIIEPIGEDAAYQDIDYEYESPQDFDNSAYYDREFELSYNNNRHEELMSLSRTEIISNLESLEFRLRELETHLLKHNPVSMLDQLQAELLQLQEENTLLKEHNAQLHALVLKTENSESSSERSREGNLVSKEANPDGESIVQDEKLCKVVDNLKIHPSSLANHHNNEPTLENGENSLNKTNENDHHCDPLPDSKMKTELQVKRIKLCHETDCSEKMNVELSIET